MPTGRSLIFDVGAHKGEDTEFYLRKGFDVIAIEANPEFCDLIRERHASHVSDGSLVVLNVAIGKKTGDLDFYVDEDVSVWGTANAEWVERNRSLGAGKIKSIKVKCEPLSDVVKEYGIPHYCKIDIEGSDLEAVSAFSADRCPMFVSIEAEKVNWEKLIEEFRLLESLGYRRYKIVDQSLVTFHRCPSPPLEGKYVDFKFQDGSSGLFGDELPGTWLSAVEAIEAYKSIFRGYAINGDSGLFPGRIGKSLFSAIAKLQKQMFLLRGYRAYRNPVETLPAPGWYDTHAAK